MCLETEVNPKKCTITFTITSQCDKEVTLNLIVQEFLKKPADNVGVKLDLGSTISQTILHTGDLKTEYEYRFYTDNLDAEKTYSLALNYNSMEVKVFVAKQAVKDGEAVEDTYPAITVDI